MADPYRSNGSAAYDVRRRNTAQPLEQPCLLRFAAWGVVGVKLKAVRQRSDYQIGVRGFAGEHTRFHRHAAAFGDGL